ncbi:hypothetical protein [Williamsia deligens]|uniref:Uncharacterized protein n=1 Tax=Williamsia deligens TaxID=321325 RepID=A0ABW3G514_9NOCA|nr:hypothetical protein [Williamsia deligens]MCP2193974.1 hypothetical protein [Williamsia deligens]
MREPWDFETARAALRAQVALAAPVRGAETPPGLGRRIGTTAALALVASSVVSGAWWGTRGGESVAPTAAGSVVPGSAVSAPSGPGRAPGSLPMLSTVGAVRITAVATADGWVQVLVGPVGTTTVIADGRPVAADAALVSAVTPRTDPGAGDARVGSSSGVGSDGGGRAAVPRPGPGTSSSSTPVVVTVTTAVSPLPSATVPATGAPAPAASTPPSTTAAPSGVVADGTAAAGGGAAGTDASNGTGSETAESGETGRDPGAS